MNQEESLMGYPKLTKKLRTYKCVSCGYKEEHIHDEAVADCSKCGFISRVTLEYPTSRPNFKCDGFPGEEIRKK